MLTKEDISGLTGRFYKNRCTGIWFIDAEDFDFVWYDLFSGWSLKNKIYKQPHQKGEDQYRNFRYIGKFVIGEFCGEFEIGRV